MSHERHSPGAVTVTRYAVGDLQGCLEPLQALLEQVHFNPRTDQLWLVGDLINRGPDSLGTLRLLKNLGDCTRIVLGNHDLHFLAVACGVKKINKNDSFSDLLATEDLADTVHWLRHQPLLYTDPSGDYSMVHAGIPPQWDLQQARAMAGEVETLLRSDRFTELLANMYGNQPDHWDDSLLGWNRYRLITNYFTRMRFCSAEGKLDLLNKLDTSSDPHFAPWFTHPQRKMKDQQIIFGHWASLQGKARAKNIYALDTGCVWGGPLTMMNLDDKRLYTYK